MEKLTTTTTSKFKAAEKEEKVFKCFEMAGDLAMVCLQVKSVRYKIGLKHVFSPGPEVDVKYQGWSSRFLPSWEDVANVLCIEKLYLIA